LVVIWKSIRWGEKEMVFALFSFFDISPLILLLDIRFRLED